jgi:hypothetical protein
MQKRIVLAIFVVLLIAVGVTTSFFYISETDENGSKLDYIKQNIAEKIENKSNYIMNKFSDEDNKQVLLPTTELVIQLDDKDKDYKDGSYFFYFDNLSEYQFFSIKQILSNKDITHSFIKDDNRLKLNVVTRKRSVVESIAKEFKNYNIEYKTKG